MFYTELTKINRSNVMIVKINQNCYLSFKILTIKTPVETGGKLNVHKTFNLRPVSTGILIKSFVVSYMQQLVE